ncbi:Hypothetical predicted protein [Paramuricea clavata]|uniref:Uncharacterized protein n=1 Tax=Paramuricea clavata TaxID=317549 RepID=A0A7D9LLZ1_PARCT|nr:Hypothetical predicted protein [Paramuricea clavata]
MRLQSKTSKLAQRNEMKMEIKKESLEVRRVADKRFSRGKSQKLYSFRNRENPRKPVNDVKENKTRPARSVVVTNHILHAQLPKKNVSIVERLVISVHSVSQESPTADRSK